jgi:hypothetical protein
MAQFNGKFILGSLSLVLNGKEHCAGCTAGVGTSAKRKIPETICLVYI